MNKLIVANWKMNPATVSEAIRLARSYDKKGVVVAPPFVFLEALGKVLKKAVLGAQDVFWKDAGPYTSEISWRQLKKLGVRYVIIGHSERRVLGETDEVINKKATAALKHGLKVILCVGEQWPVRKRGIQAAKSFVKNQLEKDLMGVKGFKNLVVAYEPIWAISTTRDRRDETPLGAGTMAGFIKGLLIKGQKTRIQVIYGGSVDARNAESFIKIPSIDGVLVGGASLKPAEFKKILSF